MARKSEGVTKVGRKLPRGFCWRNGKIYVRTDPITGDYKSTGETDLKLALMWLEQRKLIKLQPAAVAAHLVTLGQALDDHVAAKKLGKVTDKTVGYIEGKVKPLRRLIGESKPLDEIDAGTFDRYSLDRAREKGKRGKAVSGYTIRRELGELIAALRRQKRAGRFAGDLDVMMPADLQASANKVDRALSEEECTSFLRALPSQRWRSYFALSVSLGLRKSETLKVRPDDVEVRLEPVLDVQGFPTLDADGKPIMKKRFYVHVHGTKTKRSNRIVPVLPGFDSVFEYALPELPLVNMGNEFRTFNLAAKRAGIAHCSPNDFRRSWMTILGTKGVSNEQGAQMLGHASITMAATVYNQSKATQLAPVVEGVLARAPSPIQIDLPTSERQARGRKVRNGGDDDGGNDPEDPDGSNDSGQQGCHPVASNGGQGGAGVSSALPALTTEWSECAPDGMKTGLACVGVANRGAPQWIRTTDLWLRRPTHNEPNSATTANPYYYSQHQATTEPNSPLQGRDYFGTDDSHLTADADHNSEAENGVGLGSISTPEANGLASDLTVPIGRAKPRHANRFGVVQVAYEQAVDAVDREVSWALIGTTGYHRDFGPGGPFIIPTPEDLAVIEAASAVMRRKAKEATDAVIVDPTPIGGREGPPFRPLCMHCGAELTPNSSLFLCDICDRKTRDDRTEPEIRCSGPVADFDFCTLFRCELPAGHSEGCVAHNKDGELIVSAYGWSKPWGSWELLKEMAQSELLHGLPGGPAPTEAYNADCSHDTSAPVAAGDRLPTSGRLVGGRWVHGSGPAPSLDFLSRPHGPGPENSDLRVGTVGRPDWSSYLEGLNDVRSGAGVGAFPVAELPSVLGDVDSVSAVRRGPSRSPLGVPSEATATACLDWSSYLAGTGFDSNGLALGVDRAAPDSERTVETLVRVRSNGLREYSTDAGSVWGWS